MRPSGPKSRTRLTSSRTLVAGCLERLQRLGWIAHEKPFEEPSRRGIYRLEDNFLKAWYRFVFKVRSALEVAPPEAAYAELVEPALDDYIGQLVFEGVCREHLARFTRSYELPLVVEMGRWWSRRSDVELDIVARLSDGRHLFGECKWSRRPIDVGALFELKRKVEAVPHGAWKASRATRSSARAASPADWSSLPPRNT